MPKAARALGRGDDGKLDIADDVACRIDIGSVGGFVVAAHDATLVIELAAQGLGEFRLPARRRVPQRGQVCRSDAGDQHVPIGAGSQ